MRLLLGFASCTMLAPAKNSMSARSIRFMMHAGQCTADPNETLMEPLDRLTGDVKACQLRPESFTIEGSFLGTLGIEDVFNTIYDCLGTSA